VRQVGHLPRMIVTCTLYWTWGRFTIELIRMKG